MWKKTGNFKILIILILMIASGCANMFNPNSAKDANKYYGLLKSKKEHFERFLGKDRETIVATFGTPSKTQEKSFDSKLPYDAEKLLIYEGLLNDKGFLYYFYFINNSVIRVEVH